ncbi:hypothetical protein [Aestuariivivens sediminicola]|uniref:hypothetical protein n=1 Tax=Aestuariivivens sediminicola TaxID=2913560 RepID=UPI001F569581|nr:hypothetical protein [Aestuariivivens sediminicola]
MTYITDLENELDPLGYFPSCDLISSNNDVYNKIKELDKWILTTTLKGSNCSEETFVPETIWEWELAQGTDAIFTDKSEELIAFLNSKGLHNNE